MRISKVLLLLISAAISTQVLTARAAEIGEIKIAQQF